MLIDGGARADGSAAGADGGTPQQGVHIRGSFPSTPAGVAVGDGAALITSWTAIVRQSSAARRPPGTDSTAWALCASSSTSTATTTTTTTSIPPLKITLAALAKIKFGAAHPKLSATVKLTETATLTLTLLDANGHKLASWSRHETAGSHTISVALPAKARHAGKDTLRVGAHGAATVQRSVIVSA